MSEKTTMSLGLGLVMALSGAGCVGQEQPPATGSSEQAITAVSNAMGSVGTMAQASSAVATEGAASAGADDGGGGGGDGGGGGGDDLPPGEGGEPLPGGEGGEPLDGSTCVEILWTILDPFHVAIEMDQCVFASGQAIDGRIDGWLDYQGVQGAVGLGFDELTIGTQSLSGLLVGQAVEPDGNHFDVDVTFADSQTGASVELAGAVIETTPTSTTLDGSGSVGDGANDFAVDILDTLRWDDLQSCYPTSGRLSLTAPNEAPVEATFVQAPGGPAVDVVFVPGTAAVRMALPPCAGGAIES